MHSAADEKSKKIRKSKAEGEIRTRVMAFTVRIFGRDP